MWISEWVIYGGFFLMLCLCVYLFHQIHVKRALILWVGWRELDGYELICRDGSHVLAGEIRARFRRKGSELTIASQSCLSIGRQIVLFDYGPDGGGIACSWQILDTYGRVFVSGRVYRSDDLDLTKELCLILARSIGRHRAYWVWLRSPDVD